MNKTIQAKHIADETVLALIPPDSNTTIGMSSGALVLALGLPTKVVLAKMHALIRRNLVRGCACGCRGDFVLRHTH